MCRSVAQSTAAAALGEQEPLVGRVDADQGVVAAHGCLEGGLIFHKQQVLIWTPGDVTNLTVYFSKKLGLLSIKMCVS